LISLSITEIKKLKLKYTINFKNTINLYIKKNNKIKIIKIKKLKLKLIYKKNNKN